MKTQPKSFRQYLIVLGVCLTVLNLLGTVLEKADPQHFSPAYAANHAK